MSKGALLARGGLLTKEPSLAGGGLLTIEAKTQAERRVWGREVVKVRSSANDEIVDSENRRKSDNVTYFCFSRYFALESLQHQKSGRRCLITKPSILIKFGNFRRQEIG